MKRILHLAQDTDTSGFFPQLAKWHDRTRYTMYFATVNPTASWLRDFMHVHEVTVFSCDCRSRRDYARGVLRLASFLRREKIDIIHVHLFDPSVVGLVAARFAGVPLRVMTRHYSDYHTRIDKHVHVAIDRLCTAMSDGVIAVSEHTAEHLIEVEGAPRRKLRTIVNGIDLARVRMSSDGAPEQLRRELDIEDGYLLLIAARLHPEKGYEHLFRAVAELRNRVDRRFLLAVAGEGPLLAHYMEFVRDLGCEDLVRFLGFRGDLPDLMVAADLFVLPSVAEAFGLVLAEALFLGTPVVATRVGGIPEIVRDGVDGLLVPPADSSALADAIACLLADPTRRQKMTGAGRQRIEERFQFRDMVLAYEKFYEDLCKGRDAVV